MSQASAAAPQFATDVLVIGAGGAGMYAAIEAARRGADVLLADRSLIGRGGATVMAQMTVAVALGHEDAGRLAHHCADTLAAGRGLCDRALARLLCEEGPGAHPSRWTRWGVRLGARRRPLPQAHRAGPRPAALRATSISSTPARRCRRRCARRSPQAPNDPPRRRPGGHRPRDRQRPHAPAPWRCTWRRGDAGDHRGEERRSRYRRPDEAVSAATARPPTWRATATRSALAGGRRAGRHGVRAVLPHRPPGAAPGRHGPDHVGSVPLQARRTAAERPLRGVHRPVRRARTTARTS